jgi:hypothetical protein
MPDREKVIKGFECCHVMVHDLGPDKTSCGICPYKDIQTEEQIDLGGIECIAVLHDDALALLKEQGWNVLTEDAEGYIYGLPGDDGQYLMTDGKDIWIDEYVDGVDDGIWLDSGRDIREITAWMELPELPKKDRR